MATKGAKGLLVVVTLVLVILAAVSSDAQAQGRNENPGVFPPNAHYRGLTYGEWGARWWQTAFSIPVVGDDHPLISGGVFGGEDGVLFLSGVVGGVTIELTIPPGTVLFLPVVNAECSVIEPDPFHGADEIELRACANEHIDNTSGRFAVIDGVPVNNLLQFLGVTAPAGATSPSVDAGVYLLLAALRVGEHVIHFGWTLDGFSIDTTYIITVER